MVWYISRQPAFSRFIAAGGLLLLLAVAACARPSPSPIGGISPELGVGAWFVLRGPASVLVGGVVEEGAASYRYQLQEVSPSLVRFHLTILGERPSQPPPVEHQGESSPGETTALGPVVTRDWEAHRGKWLAWLEKMREPDQQELGLAEVRGEVGTDKIAFEGRGREVLLFQVFQHFKYEEGNTRREILSPGDDFTVERTYGYLKDTGILAIFRETILGVTSGQPLHLRLDLSLAEFVPAGKGR